MADRAQHNQVFERPALGLAHLRFGARAIVIGCKDVRHFGDMDRLARRIDEKFALARGVLAIAAGCSE
ncbi:hypothetical protein GCM10008174_09880 [Methylopila turkensis]|uniref:Uncharacterized protein n=1 Tax=Methylopila turkensis TaxID=1437816 RepID=A0A9W6JL96_9HYPH|nr:hypothetical protein GCM10008174_09880 [Methylopila turkensis]